MLVDLPLENLPVVDEQQARAFLEQAYERMPEALRPKTLAATPGPAAGERARVELRGTPDAVAAALAFVPNADLDYDSWIRIGMALKGALGEDGRELFEDWSATSSKDVPDTTVRTWASLKPERIGAGTIYHHALAAGWEPPPELLLNGGILVNGRHPARALLDRLSSARSATTESSPPVESLAALADPSALDGALRDLVDYMLRTAKRPQPLLALGASLCALGALMGRKYRTETNLRSNLYIVGVADSGSGKNHSREVVNELFVEAGLGHFLGGNRIASGSGLLTALHRQPAILFQLDEFGMLLAAAADRRRSPRHITDILDTMTELYTAAGTIFLGAEYANRDGRNERRDINQPCLCVYGTTTPLHFWGALQSANVADGSLARFIVLQTDDDYPDENAGAGIRRSPPALLEALLLIASGGGRRPPGNLTNLTSSIATAVDPMTVPADPAAQRIFRSLSQEITAELREARGTHATSILARIAENALKIALVRAVAADPVSPTIRAIDAEWAIGLVRGSARRTLLEVERNVADNQIEANHKRVLAVVRAAGEAGLGRSDLIRRTQFLDKRQRDDILGALAEAGLITTAMRQTATRPQMVFCAVEAAP